MQPTPQEHLDADQSSNVMQQEDFIAVQIMANMFQQLRKLQNEFTAAVQQEWRAAQLDLTATTLTPSAKHMLHWLQTNSPSSTALVNKPLDTVQLEQWATTWNALDDRMMEMAPDLFKQTLDENLIQLGPAPEQVHSPTGFEVFDAYYTTSAPSSPLEEAAIAPPTVRTELADTPTAKSSPTSPATPILENKRDPLPMLSLPSMSPFNTGASSSRFRSPFSSLGRSKTESNHSSRTVSFAGQPEYAPASLMISPTDSASDSDRSTVILSPTRRDEEDETIHSPVEDPDATTLEVLTGRKRRPTQANLSSVLQKSATDLGDRETLIVDKQVKQVKVKPKGVFKAMHANQHNLRPHEMAFDAGATLLLLRRCPRGWYWMCVKGRREEQGYVPAAFLKTFCEE